MITAAATPAGCASGTTRAGSTVAILSAACADDRVADLRRNGPGLLGQLRRRDHQVVECARRVDSIVARDGGGTDTPMPRDRRVAATTAPPIEAALRRPVRPAGPTINSTANTAPPIASACAIDRSRSRRRTPLSAALSDVRQREPPPARRRSLARVARSRRSTCSRPSKRQRGGPQPASIALVRRESRWATADLAAATTTGAAHAESRPGRQTGAGSRDRSHSRWHVPPTTVGSARPCA